MEISVSYINSKYDFLKTIKLIDLSSASAIHADLMDGVYAGGLNYQKDTIDALSKTIKPKEFHLMVNEPEKLLKSIIPLKPTCIYIHPDSTKDIDNIFKVLKDNNIEMGIVINPSDSIDTYKYLYSKVNRILLMSVIPGKGGQVFIPNTIERLQELIKYKNIYKFKIYVDGGINNETFKLVKEADGVIVGSYICK